MVKTVTYMAQDERKGVYFHNMSMVSFDLYQGCKYPIMKLD